MEAILSWHLMGMDLPVGAGERWGCQAADGLGDCTGFSWLLMAESPHPAFVSQALIFF